MNNVIGMNCRMTSTPKGCLKLQPNRMMFRYKMEYYLFTISQLPSYLTKIEFKNRWDVQKMIYNGGFLIIRGEFLFDSILFDWIVPI